MPNVDLAIEVMVAITQSQRGRTTKEGGWRQAVWGALRIPQSAANRPQDVVFDAETNRPVGVGSCQTAFCAAGWANQIAGRKVDWQPSGSSGRSWEFDGTKVFNEEGRRMDADKSALEVLGIQSPNFSCPCPEHRGRKFYLFGSTTDLDHMWIAFSQIANMPIEMLKIEVADRAEKRKVAAVERAKAARAAARAAKRVASRA